MNTNMEDVKEAMASATRLVSRPTAYNLRQAIVQLHQASDWLNQIYAVRSEADRPRAPELKS